MTERGLGPQQCRQFHEQGFVVARQLSPPNLLMQLCRLAVSEVVARHPPVELETDLGYPGAPGAEATDGGQTLRRLLQAYDRHELLRCWAHHPALIACLRQLFANQAVYLNPNHHNCIMTKHPRYSSMTLWHQDIRYWSFSDHNLINVWLALGQEYRQNGGLLLVPGSHLWQLPAQRFDSARFLRLDLAENQAALRGAVAIDLRPGDALFFQASTFHAAGRNDTEQIKYSVVYTYHTAATKPRAGSRSARGAPLAC